MLIMTAQEVRELADRIDDTELYNSGLGYVAISIGKHPNGREYIEFEQPSVFAECNGMYYRYDTHK